MKVSELIEKLKRCDQDYDVDFAYWQDDHVEADPVETVKVNYSENKVTLS